MISIFAISQTLVAVAAMFDLVSFQFKERRSILLCLGASSILVASHFFLLSNSTAGGCTLLTGVRFLVAYFSKARRWAWGFAISALLILGMTYQSPLNFLPFLAAVLGTFGSFAGSDKTLRICVMAATSLWVAHNALIGSPACLGPGVGLSFKQPGRLLALLHFRKNRSKETIASRCLYRQHFIKTRSIRTRSELNPKKIAVIGISGTGKSTIARRLSKCTGFPLYHMDTILWSENWTENNLEQVESELKKIVAAKSWIVEGWIGPYSKSIMETADTIIYLDYPGWMAAWGGLMRLMKYRSSHRPELSKGCHDSWNFEFFRVMLLREERPRIESLLASWNLQNMNRCRSRKAAEASLLQLTNDCQNG